MSAREWKPGDVASARYGRVFAVETGGGVRWVFDDGSGGRDHAEFAAEDMEPLDLRPLVVIDPSDRQEMERLLEAFSDAEVKAHDGKAVECGSGSCWIGNMQAALREFANPTPPRPEEPTGLGAVVEDAGGHRWVRTRASTLPWVGAKDDGDAVFYDDIDAVRILSAGVDQ